MRRRGDYMWILYNMVIHIWLGMNFITLTYCLYHLVVALAAFRKNRKLPENAQKHKFAAIIAARNEETVIGSLIESIQLQNYPRELIDIIVVADNCTDSTAEVAEKAGAIVYKRFNKVEIGKGYVLRFIFDKLLAERDIYDAYCVFDADNLVDKDFFEQMNRAIGAGYEVAQGYRDMKNPSDNWISGGHALFYWMENRFFNYARDYHALSSTINGTGFMILSKVIKEVGFETLTSTEDIEFSLKCVISGRRVGWVPDARVFDEQPVKMSQSFRQRVRWTIGLMQCYKHYAGDFARAVKKRPEWYVLDMFMFLLSFPVMIIGMMAGFLNFLLIVFRIIDPVGSIVNLLFLAAGSALAFWLIAILTLILENKWSKKMLSAVALYPVFNLLWVAIYVFCLVKRNVEWKPIVHVRNISIREFDSKIK